jgi:pimeloyl-ACP methyl ester carboxylesterase
VSLSLIFALLLLVLSAGMVTHGVLCRLERRRHAPPGRLVDVGGYRLHLLESGEGGPTVVLDSALAGTTLSWSAIQPEVARLTRVLSYDRAGFGWSDRGPHPRRVDFMAEELSRLLRIDSQAPYVIVSHSYGGWIARVLASRYPELVAGMVLVDVPHPREWIEPTGEQRHRVTAGARMARVASFLAPFGLARLAYRFGRRAGSRERVQSLVGRVPAPLRSTLRTFWVRRQTLGALASQIEHAPESARLVAAESRSLGNHPLVVLTAARPDAVRHRDQDETAGLSARGRHWVAKSADHWIPLDEPELIVKAARDVVEEVRRDQRSS